MTTNQGDRACHRKDWFDILFEPTKRDLEEAARKERRRELDLRELTGRLVWWIKSLRRENNDVGRCLDAVTKDPNNLSLCIKLDDALDSRSESIDLLFDTLAYSFEYDVVLDTDKIIQDVIEQEERDRIFAETPEGKIENRRGMVEAALLMRFKRMPRAIERAIQAISDLDALEVSIRQALDCQSLDEFATQCLRLNGQLCDGGK